ncbi:primosomal protein N' [Novispirillum itersonii]|uniref:primosomal protein N' n=1 Tax=Novispirillum itersonii TaxID=189 RepID=UPI001613E202
MPPANPSPSADMAAPSYPEGTQVAVLLPLPLAGAYDYRVPAGCTVCDGQAVRVPLGRRQETGIVWGAGRSGLDPAKIRPLQAVLDHAAPLPEVTRRFVDWVAAYTLSLPGAVLKMVIPVPEALDPPAAQVAWRLSGAEVPGLRQTPARDRVLRTLQTGVPMTTPDLAREAGVSPSVIKGLAEAGLLAEVPFAMDPDLPEPDGDHPGPTLSPVQADAAKELVLALGQGYSATLLEGVTGSGKTEVYFEAIAAALRQGQQVLVLVPEITLTTQWLGRFRRRFGADPAVWHSDLTPARRRRTWRAIADGRARVVVGARSALFLPYQALGLIVVDEEHEVAFKQEEGVIYHARDMAVVRAHLGNIPVVLASATPSLETVANVEAGRYIKVDLPVRHAGATLPTIDLIDIRRFPPEKGDWGQSWLSPPLVTALERTLEAGEQAMLFLNRRGYAPLTLCRTCGHRVQCPQCTAWLVEHRRLGKLQCHHCGHQQPLPKVCPSCGAEDALVACGPGVERVAEEASRRFPQARVELVASDTLAGPQGIAGLLERIERKEVDLLIGTQVLAKGLHFPMLTLVGIVDADLGLSGGDLRAAERTFQVLSQVAGRAGRGERPGRVMVQTFQPDHPVLQAMATGDMRAFREAESEGRRLLRMPPFGRLVAVIVSGETADAVESVARALARQAPQGAGLEVLGPAPAPLALLRGRHRWRLLLKAPREVRVQTVVRQWLGGVACPSAVRIQVDIDPYSFL